MLEKNQNKYLDSYFDSKLEGQNVVLGMDNKLG